LKKIKKNKKDEEEDWKEEDDENTFYSPDHKEEPEECPKEKINRRK
jgi:hypothetical protein